MLHASHSTWSSAAAADKSFEQGVEIAAGLGYRYVEPMVHTGWELLSRGRLLPLVLARGGPAADARDLRAPRRRRWLSISGHSPLMKPEAAVPRLTRAIVLADALGARWVNTDEMLQAGLARRRRRVRPRDHALHAHPRRPGRAPPRRRPLHRAARRLHQDRRGPAADRRARPVRRASASTGTPATRYLAGLRGPLRGAESVKDLVRHVHAKDISIEHAERERGVVTGTPVGCACGDGVVDWERVLAILAGRDLVFSVECGTIEQAERSLDVPAAADRLGGFARARGHGTCRASLIVSARSPARRWSRRRPPRRIRRGCRSGSRCRPARTQQYRGLDAVSARVAWVGGSAGEVRRTLDGGRSWQIVSPPGSAGLLFRDVEAERRVQGERAVDRRGRRIADLHDLRRRPQLDDRVRQRRSARVLRLHGLLRGRQARARAERPGRTASSGSPRPTTGAAAGTCCQTPGCRPRWPASSRSRPAAHAW